MEQFSALFVVCLCLLCGAIYYYWVPIFFKLLRLLGLLNLDQPVKIIEIKTENSIELLAVLCRFDKVYFQLTLTGENIVVIPDLSAPKVLCVGQLTSIATITPASARPFRYDYQSRFWPMPTRDNPSLTHVYRLPFLPGTAFRIIQGYGDGTHVAGTNLQYAVDFSMPEGTVICATRDGVVAGYWAGSNLGGAFEGFGSYGNYLLIRHDDDTYSWYGHLKQDGVFVALSEHVFVGQPIALSGNTGLSSSPHLHYCIYTIDKSGTWTTIPVSFATSSGPYSNPRVGDIVSHPSEKLETSTTFHAEID